MVKIRRELELALMRKSGKITARVLKKVLQNIKVGVSCLELDELAEQEIKKYKGEPSFKSVQGFDFTICITINEQVVHGIPTERKIQAGDVVSIDLGTLYKGWHSDAAWTVVVKNKSSEIRKFLKIGEEALWNGVSKVVDENKIGDIGAAIQEKIEGAGYSVVRSLVGHGVGKALHEEPEVPGYGQIGTGLKLKKGMTLAIEVIYTKGKPEVVLEQDGWTVSTKDGTLSGLFEMTVVVEKDRPEVLTDWRSI